MFNTNYSKFYFNIISHRLKFPATETVEVHHIIPKTCGGTDDKSNLASLTAREHFICHCLLIRMLSGTNKRRMIFAAHNMIYWKSASNDREFKISSRMYQLLKSKNANARKGPLSEAERAKYTPDRMKNVWLSRQKHYKITFPSSEEYITNDLTRWCEETGNSLTTLRKALKTGAPIMSNYAKGMRGSGCKPSKLDGVLIMYHSLSSPVDSM